MAIKIILRKFFTRYGIVGAKRPSFHGCYEPKVPASGRGKAVSSEQQTETKKSQ